MKALARFLILILVAPVIAVDLVEIAMGFNQWRDIDGIEAALWMLDDEEGEL